MGIFNTAEFDHRLYTGFSAADEADYLETMATDVKTIRIEGFGRCVLRPLTEDEEENTTSAPESRATSRTLRVPVAFTSCVAMGFLIERSTDPRAAN